MDENRADCIVFTPTITTENSLLVSEEQQMLFIRICISLKNSHEPYVVIASGDCVYKMDYNKVLEYHIAKQAQMLLWYVTTCNEPNEM